MRGPASGARAETTSTFRLGYLPARRAGAELSPYPHGCFGVELLAAVQRNGSLSTGGEGCDAGPPDIGIWRIADILVGGPEGLAVGIENGRVFQMRIWTLTVSATKLLPTAALCQAANSRSSNR